LQQYDWPGNLRELRNALERALILSRGETVTLCQLPPEIRQTAPTSDRSIRLEDVERRHIVRILESCSGNRTRAAELLGISRSTLKRNLADMARAGFSVVPSVGAEHDG
jgi:transcriptional regulator of acetoin/glycerol metabolism